MYKHIKSCTGTSSGNHRYYKAKDFTLRDVTSGNATAVAVMRHGKRICKLCGFEHPVKQGG